MYSVGGLKASKIHIYILWRHPCNWFAHSRPKNFQESLASNFNTTKKGSNCLLTGHQYRDEALFLHINKDKTTKKAQKGRTNENIYR